MYPGRVTFSWVTAFATTLIVETPVYLWALRGRLSWPRAALVAVLVNALTHPLAWTLGTPGSPVRFAAVEGGVWLAEAILLWSLVRAARPTRALPFREAFLPSLAANALSAGVGLIIAG
jgi:hypothetical protein